MTRRIAVTGSASGIGRATAELARKQGDQVIGIDLTDAEVCADLSTADGRREVVEGVTRLCDGVIDAVVACAGITQPKPLTVSVNYFGVTEVLAGLRPLLARAEAPRAAVVASMVTTQPYEADIVEACLAGDESRALELAAAVVECGRGYPLYPTSKVALARWVRRTSVAPGWADAGVPLNAVGPGVVLSPMTTGLVDDPAMRQRMDEAVPMPLNGYAAPEAVAHPLLWLVSPENTHVTGQLLYVDGGAEATLRGDDLW